jgi:UDP-N-acetyl-D-glucosamine dehydrogenase
MSEAAATTAHSLFQRSEAPPWGARSRITRTSAHTATAEHAVVAPRHVASRAHEILIRSGRPIGYACVLVVGASHEPGVAETREAPPVEIIRRLREEGAHVDYYDPLVRTLAVDDEQLSSVRVALRGQGPSFGRGESVDVKRYDLVVLAMLHPDHDYDWLGRCSAVLDCTYGMPVGKRRFLP